MTVYQFLQKLAPYTGYKIIGKDFESRPYRKGKIFLSSELKYFPKIISRIILYTSSPEPWIYIYVSNEESFNKEPITYQNILNTNIDADIRIDVGRKHFDYIREIKIEDNTIVIQL